MSTALHEALHGEVQRVTAPRRSLWWRVVNALGLWRFLRVRRAEVAQ
jgi:hypothetical protein